MEENNQGQSSAGQGQDPTPAPATPAPTQVSPVPVSSAISTSENSPTVSASPAGSRPDEVTAPSATPSPVSTPPTSSPSQDSVSPTTTTPTPEAPVVTAPTDGLSAPTQNVSRGTLPPPTPAPWRRPMIGALIVVIIVVTLWYALTNTGSDRVGDDQGPRITVSDEQEQGNVIITDQAPESEITGGSVTVPEGMVEISAYYSNTQRDPGATDCARVYALTRVVEKKYNSQAINTARGLLQPLTEQERVQGWVSHIPEGVLLKSISIVDGVATVNYTSNINRVAGSCAVLAARAQIEQTIRQLPGVTTVRICANGDCDGALQP